jgi:glycogen debranching enzyme
LHVDPELAKQEIRCLMQGAQPDGFMPHMILWEKGAHEVALREVQPIWLADPFFTATIQPPVVARAVLRIHEATRDTDFVREVVPPIRRFFRWLKAVRDPDDDGLVAIIQPDESGLDASPKYDALMGISPESTEETLPELERSMQRLYDAYAPYRSEPARIPALDVFTWEDVMVNAIYADGLRCLAKLVAIAGDPAHEANEFAARATRVRQALETKCWDEDSGVFWDLAGWAEKPARTLTFTSLFPLILEDLDPRKAKRLVEEHLLNEKEFWLPYPIPSVAASERAFDPGWRAKTTWRGPTWVNVNWYLYWGLRAHGRGDVASHIVERTIAMIDQSGIREFYDPRSGDGEGARDFGWTTLVLDLIAAERSTA